MQVSCTKCAKQASGKCEQPGGPFCRSCCPVDCSAHSKRLAGSMHRGKRGVSAGYGHYVYLRRVKQLRTSRAWLGLRRKPLSSPEVKDLLDVFLRMGPFDMENAEVFSEGALKGLPVLVFLRDQNRLLRTCHRIILQRRIWDHARMQQYMTSRSEMDAALDRRFGEDPAAHIIPDSWSESSDEEDFSWEAQDIWMADSEWKDEFVWEDWNSWWCDDSASKWQSSATAWASEERLSAAGSVPETSDIGLTAAWTYPVASVYAGGNDFAKIISLTDVESSLPTTPLFDPSSGTGRFPWDVMSEKCRPHATREIGLYFCRTIAGRKNEDEWKAMMSEGFRLGSTRDSAQDAQKTLLSWMMRRPAMLRQFASAVAFRELEELCPECSLPAQELGGFWMFFQCRGFPDVTSPSTIWDGHQFGAHGTSMYCVRRIVENATLSTGMASLNEGSREITGIFYHLLRKAGLCQATYMHYVSLESKGWFYAPLVIIAAQVSSFNKDGSARKTIVKRKGADNDQNLTYESEHYICGVAFHIVHAVEIMQAPRAYQYNCDGGWLPSLELNPRVPWEDILKEGSERRHQPARS